MLKSIIKFIFQNAAAAAAHDQVSVNTVVLAPTVLAPSATAVA